MNEPQDAIKVQNLDHLGIVAGIDEMELVEEVNKKVKNSPLSPKNYNGSL